MTNIERRLTTLEDLVPRRPIDGIYQVDPKDVGEFGEWARAGYGFRIRQGSIWSEIATAARDHLDRKGSYGAND